MPEPLTHGASLLPHFSQQNLFTDVYAGSTLLPHLQEQREALNAHIAKFPEKYPELGAA